MANRFIRNAAVLAKAEVTYGTDPTPTGGSNAMLVSNMSISPLNAQNVDRALVRPYFGGSEQLVGVRNVQVSFDIEAAGSGAAGTAPAYGPLLLACGMAETVTAEALVEYEFVSSSFGSVTIYWYDDGALHEINGARGTFELLMNLGERPVFRFTFTGLYVAPTATSLPSTTLTGFVKPLVVTEANTADVTLGCTYSAGELSSGTGYPSRGLTLNAGNSVSHIPLLGAESVEITGRDVSGAFQLDLTAAQEVTFAGTVTANTTQSVGLVHGTTAGNIMVLHAPAVQLINYTKAEIEGKRLIGYDLRLLPTSGNDELVLAFK